MEVSAILMGVIVNNNKSNVLEVGFTGCEKMCLFLKDYFEKELEIKSNIKIDKRTDNRIKSIKITNKDGIKIFYDFIYKNSNIHLNRKKNKFDEYFKNNE